MRLKERTRFDKLHKNRKYQIGRGMWRIVDFWRGPQGWGQKKKAHSLVCGG